MQLLFNSTRLPDLQVVQPGVHFLRGTHPDEHRHEAHWGDRVPCAAHGDVESMGRLGPQRDGDSATFQKCSWVGKSRGIRAPEEQETPVAWGEVSIWEQKHIVGVL